MEALISNLGSLSWECTLATDPMCYYFIPVVINVYIPASKLHLQTPLSNAAAATGTVTPASACTATTRAVPCQLTFQGTEPWPLVTDRCHWNPPCSNRKTTPNDNCPTLIYRCKGWMCSEMQYFLNINMPGIIIMWKDGTNIPRYKSLCGRMELTHQGINHYVEGWN